jgi:AhpD family alkylhydroperoxidase
MARLPLIDPTDEPEELRSVFDQLRETRGRVPGIYRILAHQPAVLNAHRAYFNAALDTGLLPRAFKEKIAFRVASLRGSAYSSASHRSYAVNQGVSEAEIAAIGCGAYDGMAANEQAALSFAHFPTAEIVEIVALIGIMELASSFGAVFGLEPD